jgi:putative transposase
MPNYHRFYVHNHPVFITIVTHERQSWLTNDETMAILRTSMQRIKKIHPFRHVAHVVLPDHLHWIFEPTGDSPVGRQLLAAFCKKT